MTIRTKTLENRAKNKITTDQLILLKEELEFFKSLPFLDNEQTKTFNDLRQAIYEEEEKQNEILRMAAGVQWREEGERSSSYFLNLLNTKKVMSTMSYLETEVGTLNQIDDILKYTKSYYSNIYSKSYTVPVRDFYDNCPQLSHSANTHLSTSLTLEEINNALKS